MLPKLLPLALALLLAGCVGGDALPQPSATAPAQHRGAVPGATSLAFAATGCDASGGIGINPNPRETPSEAFGIPPPFEYADTWEFLGLPNDAPVASPGNWHVAVVCEAWDLEGAHAHDPNLGLVGLAVRPPPFEGLEPAERNFLVGTVATHDATLTRLLGEAGLYVYPGVARVDQALLGLVGISDMGTRWTVTSVVETAGHGIFETHATLDDSGSAWPLVRWWLILEGADGALHPAALDMTIEGGPLYAGHGFFSHWNTGDHPPVGRADRVMPALGFRDVALGFRLSVLDATVEDKWAH